MFPRRVLAKALLAIRFVFFFLWQLILANIYVAYDVMTPRHKSRSGVIFLPLDARTDLEIVMLANLISLTPGTLSLDVSADRELLYIHAMYIDDVDKFRKRIKDGLEKRLLEVLR